jgi:hypothetical protein
MRIPTKKTQAAKQSRVGKILIRGGVGGDSKQKQTTLQASRVQDCRHERHFTGAPRI